jgi:hypothetical protein
LNSSALRLSASLCAFLSASLLFGQSGQIGGNSETLYETLYLVTQEDEGLARYFENWTNLSYEKDQFRFDVGYEAHLPPAPASRDTAGQGIYQRTFTYMDKGFTFKAGTYLTRLGNGLTLVAQRNRDIGLNTDLDGLYTEYTSEWFEGRAIAASPRDAAGMRYAALQAGELRLSVLKKSFVGMTYVTTRTSEQPNDYWGSLFAGTNGEYGNFQAEWAARTFLEDHALGKVAKEYEAVFPHGKALYVMGNLLLGKLTLFGEAKHYQDFNLFEGATYNNPPSGIKEHVFSLPNKRQLVQNADNEQGVHFGAEFPVIEDNLLSFDYSKSIGIEKSYLLYEEYYGQFEGDLGTRVHGILGAGMQTDLESRNLNFIVHPSFPINEKYTLKTEWQHQHTEILLTHRMFYDQQYILSLERSPNLVLSLITETATDQLEKNPIKIAGAKIWSGIQVNWNFLEHYDLAVFAGTRKKGKVCAGGVCVLKPELKGLELNLNSHF